MTQRLQVLLPDSEYREIQRIARSRQTSVAEWVRQALQLASRAEPLRSMEKKLDAIRAATVHNHPTGDIDQMLAEIESGYLQDTKS
jgi:hypothetical protein